MDSTSTEQHSFLHHRDLALIPVERLPVFRGQHRSQMTVLTSFPLSKPYTYRIQSVPIDPGRLATHLNDLRDRLRPSCQVSARC